jgi:Arc/MetJ family transcription regulator
VPKTLVDVEDGLLEQAADLPDTHTKKDTVNAALREVIARRSREAELAWWRTDPLPDLRDPDVMAQAWR